MIAGMTVRKKHPNHDRIDKTKLQIASGSVRAAGDEVATGGGVASSAIAPF